jgi:hypothetical protein
VIVGPLVGWRLWHVDGGRLRSWTRGTPWPTHARFDARCRRHAAPHLGHGCGVYALRTRELAESLVAALPGPARQPIALGRVSLWGHVVENVDGWRAQHAYPFDLELIGGDEGTARSLRQAYAVDVTAA